MEVWYSLSIKIIVALVTVLLGSAMVLLNMMLWAEIIDSVVTLREKRESQMEKRELFASIKKAKKQLKRKGIKADTVILNRRKYEWFQFISRIYGLKVIKDNLDDDVDFIVKRREKDDGK